MLRKLTKDYFGSFAAEFDYFSSYMFSDYTSKKLGISFFNLVFPLTLGCSTLLWNVMEPLGMFLAVLC